MANTTITTNTGSLTLEYALRSQVVQPLTGVMWMELAQSFPVSIVPGTGSMTANGIDLPLQTLTEPSPAPQFLFLTGYAPIVSANKLRTVITPNTGGLLSGAASPIEINGSIIAPGTGALALAGYTPVIAINTIGQSPPSTGAATLLGAAPVQAIGTTPLAAALALQGFAPTITGTYSITPVTGALSFASTQGASLNITISPNSGSLGATGVQGFESLAESPSSGALSIAGNYPGIGLVGNITPQTGSLSFSGLLPQLSAPSYIIPTAGALNASGIAPVQYLAVTISALAGALTFIGYQPPSSQYGAIVPATGALGYLGNPPSITINGKLAPATQTLAFVGSASTATQSVLEPTATSAAGITGFAPQLSQGFVITPATGSIGLASDAQGAVVPQSAYPAEYDAFITGYAPSVTTQGPPVVTSVTIELLSYSCSIIFTLGNGNMAAVTSVNELNAFVVNASFFDINGNPYIPTGLNWQLWDDTNKEAIQTWQPLTPAESVQFEVSGSLNTINNTNNLTERHMVLLQTIIPGGEVRYDNAYFSVIAIPDLGN